MVNTAIAHKIRKKETVKDLWRYYLQGTQAEFIAGVPEAVNSHNGRDESNSREKPLSVPALPSSTFIPCLHPHKTPL
jgi:hypothetical protein